MSKDLRFHLTDEQWQGILFELRNARIGELEEEIERLKGWMAKRNWVDTQGKSAVEVVRERNALREEVERRDEALKAYKAQVKTLGGLELGERTWRIALEKEVERLTFIVNRKPIDDMLTERMREATEKLYANAAKVEPKKCGCGASVRDVPTHEFPWNCNPSGCLTQPMKDGWHCTVCGEELKA